MEAIEEIVKLVPMSAASSGTAVAE